MNARSVNQDNLTLWLRDDALNSEAGGLWFVGDGGNFLTDELIQQRVDLPAFGLPMKATYPAR